MGNRIRTDMGTLFNQTGTVDEQAAPTAASTQTTTAEPTAAPAGGTGATAGAYDTAGNRDTAITCINDTRTRLAEQILKLDAAIVRVAELETMMSNLGISA